LKDAKKIVNLKKKYKNLNIFVVKQNRFNLPIIKLKDAIQKKRFGKIFLATVRVRWKRDKKYYNSAKWRGKWKTDGGVL
jgi:UDP-N-acetyl-2-amino-2-deoxyglucuronate dehydrogenase